MWDILQLAFRKEFITIENLIDLLHFREVAYDIFKLLDQDNDDLLSFYTVNYLQNKFQGGELSQIWKKIEK